MSATIEREITTCTQLGFHAYAAGPCFDRIEQAAEYRDRLEQQGVTWWPQDRYLPPLRTPQPTEGES